MPKDTGAESEETKEVVEPEPASVPMESPADDTPSNFRVDELVSLSETITGQPNFFAAGAMTNAGLANDEMISKDDFKKHVEAFKEVGAF